MATATRMCPYALLALLAVTSVSGTYSGCRKPCTREYRPVCAADGSTYSNLCLFQNAKCGKPDLEVRYAGRCGHPRDTSPKTTSAPPRPRPCRRSCPEAEAPVCGSNGKTYDTICAMQNDNCGNNGPYIYMVAPRPCAGSNTDENPSVDLMTSCQRACPFNYVPVCGSDGISYGNECAFQVAKCRAGGNLHMVHQGRCSSQTNYQSDSGKKSPVAKQPPCPRFCPYNYSPVCASNGRSYVNECAFRGVNCRVGGGTLTIVHKGRCSTKGSHYGKTPPKTSPKNCLRRCTKHYSPVCGSDGKTYGNQCVFDIAKCQSQNGMKVLHNGPCNKKPTSCLRGCLANYDPVCGSDGKTYANKCTFGVANCRVGYKMTIVYDGECKMTPKPNYTPKPYTPKPYTPKPYTPKPYPTKSYPTSCRRPCPRHLDPVCGSDGKTYPNKCVFDVYNCKANDTLTVVHQGSCQEGTTPTPATPSTEDPQGSCFQACPSDLRPVCSSQGITYPNECFFDVKNCLAGGTLTKTEGPCEDDGDSSSGSPPEDNHGPCFQLCPSGGDPVCASNGITYPNECFFHIKNCLANNTMSMSPGMCQGNHLSRRDVDTIEAEAALETDDCDRPCFLLLDPVCGSDGETYSNDCVFEAANCKASGTLSIVHRGTCTSEFSDVDDAASPCNGVCPLIYQPVCASNGQTYPNQCSFDAANCRLGNTLTVTSQGACSQGFDGPATEAPSCGQVCPDVYRPLCASNGNTYSNECEFAIANCLEGGGLTVTHDGSCEEVEEGTYPCLKACPLNYDPVCASNGKTYANKCLVEVASCELDETLKIVSNSECPTAF